jgi:hypothetical protein
MVVPSEALREWLTVCAKATIWLAALERLRAVSSTCRGDRLVREKDRVHAFDAFVFAST